MSGLVLRRMITEHDTNMKANSTPMFASSAASRSGRNPARIADMVPQIRMIIYGDLVFLWTLARDFGSRLSRVMAKITLLCPYIMTINPEVRPIRTPVAITDEPHWIPIELNANAAGAEILWYYVKGSIPQRTKVRETYRMAPIMTVQCPGNCFSRIICIFTCS